jgi:arginase
MTTVRSYAIVEAPSVLGTAPKWSGVRRLPEALLGAGLADAIGARLAGRVEPPPYVPGRDPETQVTNAPGLREYAFRLADAVGDVLGRGEFPVILGGDCSILLGSLLGTARRGRHGVVFIDGHIDFYAPDINEWDGRAANSELAFAAGRGPAALTDFGIGRPLVRDDDIVAVGFRDQANQTRYGCSLPAMALALSRDEVRRIGPGTAAEQAIAHLTRANGPDGYFVHVDADAVDGKLMPAVDDPAPDGFDWDEMTTLLRAIAQDDRATGIQLTIYNPDADPAGAAGRTLARVVGTALRVPTRPRPFDRDRHLPRSGF